MKNLINMVLDVRKMEVGESKMQIQPHPLNKWIEDVSQDFISEGEAKNVRIRYELDPRIETVSFDKDKCETILSNLLINALKHSPENTEITITSELLSEESRIRISIIDQGNGLQQVDTRKLFTRFYQGVIYYLCRFRVIACLLLLLGFGLPVFMLPEKMEGEGKWVEYYNKVFDNPTFKDKVKPVINKA